MRLHIFEAAKLSNYTATCRKPTYFWSQVTDEALDRLWGRLCTTRNGDTYVLHRCHLHLCTSRWRLKRTKKKKTIPKRLFQAIEPRRRSRAMRGSRKPSTNSSSWFIKIAGDLITLWHAAPLAWHPNSIRQDGTHNPVLRLSITLFLGTDALGCDLCSFAK